MVSERVAREEAPRVREEIAKGKLLNERMDQLWKLAEHMTRDVGNVKKLEQIDGAAATLDAQTLSIFTEAETGTRDLSAAGKIRYTRWYVMNAKGERNFPADDALGIVRGCTPGAAKRLCHRGAKSQSYGESSESLALLSGIGSTPNTIQRLIGAVGPDMGRGRVSEIRPPYTPIGMSPSALEYTHQPISAKIAA